MPALAVTIADAVVARLNAGGYSLPLSATRSYRPISDLRDLAELRVTVWPRLAKAQTPATRGGAKQRDFEIDIGFQQRVAETTTAIDALVALVEEVGDSFAGQLIADTAMVIEEETAPIADPDHLHERKVFTSVLTLTFRAVR